MVTGPKSGYLVAHAAGRGSVQSVILVLSAPAGLPTVCAVVDWPAKATAATSKSRSSIVGDGYLLILRTPVPKLACDRTFLLPLGMSFTKTETSVLHWNVARPGSKEAQTLYRVFVPPVEGLQDAISRTKLACEAVRLEDEQSGPSSTPFICNV